MAGEYNYTDADGVTHTGWLSDEGKMYTDSSMTNRIPIGSSVTSGDGQTIWYMTSEGGKTAEQLAQSGTLSGTGQLISEMIYDSSGSTSSDGASTGGASYSGLSQPAYSTATAEQYINNIYNQKLEAAKAALKSAYEQNVLTLNDAKAQIPGTYQDARNQTASTAAVNQANFNEYAAASGLNSGTGGQARLAMDNALLGSLSGLDKQQAKDTAAAVLQLAQLKAKYEGDIASAIAQGKFEEAQALYDNYMNEQAAARQQSQFDAQMASQQKQFDVQMTLSRDQMAQNQSNTSYDKDLQAAQISGDYSGMAKWGWKPDQIAAANSRFTRPAQTYVAPASTTESILSANQFVRSAIANDRSAEEIAKGLEQYVKNGKITEAEAIAILKLAGLA